MKKTERKNHFSESAYVPSLKEEEFFWIIKRKKSEP